MSDDYLHGVRGVTVREQRVLDAAREELERLRHLDPDRASYGGSRDEIATPLVTIEPVERKVLDDDAALQLIGMVFRSRSSNAQPHLVTLRPDGTVQCTCDAHVSCWAQRSFRRVRGMPL